jgi:hypothetical protein
MRAMRIAGFRSLLAVTVVVALGLAACGSSSSKSSGGDTGSTSGGTASKDDLSALLEKAKTANVKVTYKAQDKADSFTLVQYNGDTSFTTGDSQFVTKGDKAYTCSNITSSTPTCVEAPGGAAAGDALQSGFFGLYSALLSSSVANIASRLSGVTRTTSTETVAGREAKCVKFSGALLGQTGNLSVCVDSKTGVLLKATSDTSVTAGSSIQATDFAESSADDVKLPAEPTQITLPTMPGGATIPTVPTS